MTQECCSWCHALNDTSRTRTCWRCGHDATQPRLFCQCRQCVENDDRRRMFVAQRPSSGEYDG